MMMMILIMKILYITIKKNNIIYLSEGYALEDAKSSILLSKSRLKGNINGNIKKKPTEEWLNIFNF